MPHHASGIEVIGAGSRASTREPGPLGSAAGGLAVLDLETAVKRADVGVECASAEALGAHGPRIVGSGTDLLVVSLGALADPALCETLLTRGPCRCLKKQPDRLSSSTDQSAMPC